MLMQVFSFNRTSMELKLVHIELYRPQRLSAFNRTSMELKHFQEYEKAQANAPLLI